MSQELIKLILNPGMSDREGRTELDARGEAIRTASEGIRSQELNNVLFSLDNLQKFRSSDLSMLFSYSKKADLPLSPISRKAVGLIRDSAVDIDLLKKAELARFVLESSPEDIDENELRTALRPLIDTRPWIYAELLAYKNAMASVELIQIALLSGLYNYGAFYSLLSLWIRLQKGNHTFLAVMAGKLMSVLPEDRAKSLIRRKLSELAIPLAKEETELVRAPEFVQFKHALKSRSAAAAG